MEIQNTHKIVDAFCEQQKKFAIIKSKADDCVKQNMEIQKQIQECYKIFGAVFKNFSPERVPLDVFMYKDRYHRDSKSPKWIIGKKNLPQRNRYYYYELCLNIIGLTLLPEYGQKSYNIIEEQDQDNTIHNFLSLKEKIPQDALKNHLSPEKLDLLNRMLDNIESLNYNSEFVKQQKVKFDLLVDNYGKFDTKPQTYNYIRMEAERTYLRCKFMADAISVYTDMDFGLTNIDTRSATFIEQVSDEIIACLDEYKKFLDGHKDKVDKYYEDAKGKFVKELIILNLKQKPK